MDNIPTAGYLFKKGKFLFFLFFFIFLMIVLIGVGLIYYFNFKQLPNIKSRKNLEHKNLPSQNITTPSIPKNEETWIKKEIAGFIVHEIPDERFNLVSIKGFVTKEANDNQENENIFVEIVVPLREKNIFLKVNLGNDEREIYVKEGTSSSEKLILKKVGEIKKLLKSNYQIEVIFFLPKKHLLSSEDLNNLYLYNLIENRPIELGEKLIIDSIQIIKIYSQ